MCTANTDLRAFDGAKELATFGSPVVYKSFHVLVEAFNCLLHLGIKALSSEKALDEIIERLMDLAIPCHDRASLS